MRDLPELLQRAVDLHVRGRFAEAEVLYLQILQAQPKHFDALHMLGVMRYHQGRYTQSLDLIGAALQISSNFPPAIANLALVLNALNRPAEALASCDGALAIEPRSAQAQYTRGLLLRELNRPAEALASFDKALEIVPDYVDALNGRGITLAQLNHPLEALASFDKALANAPKHAEAHNNRGITLRRLNRAAEALESFDKAVAVKPTYAEAFSNRGNALADLQRLEEALASYDNAILLKPDYAEAFANRGRALAKLNRPSEALTNFDKALAIRPNDPNALNGRGGALVEFGKLDEAVAAYRQAICIKPDLAEPHSNLGVALTRQGKLDEAVAAFREAIRIKPNMAEAHSNLAPALTRQGKLDEAVAALRQAIHIEPGWAEAHSNLGAALIRQGKLDEAVAALRQAIHIEPGWAEAHSNLGVALTCQGKPDDAVAAYREAIRIKPDDAEAFSSLLLCLNYDDKLTNDYLLAVHRQWDERFGRLTPRPIAYANDCEAARRLKIGYVSPDYRRHSVAYFLEPLLKEHDRHAVEVFCYAEVEQPDSVTTRLQGLADHWLVTVGLSDQEVADRIRTDGIDILVDLAGHTGNNRLLVFARKPAPVQATWLGYPNTTGLKAIDYRLVDAVTDPAGEADAWASETLMRLENGYLCYGGNVGPAPTPPPCLASGTVTFGSFNNASKISGGTIDVWAKLIRRSPHARLLLKGKAFNDADPRALFLNRLRQREVPPERVELMPWLQGTAEHLAIYHRVDIALDTFPYNGTTTTCEALWMGLPVITLRGHRHAGRVGASLLTQIGLTDLIANSMEEYVEIALELAGNPGRLDYLRRTLRPRMVASSVCDAAGFARKMEAAFRTMWKHWCETSKGNSRPI